MAKLVFGLLLGLLVAMVLLAPGANAGPSCTTNGNSPTQGDANDCIQFIRQLGNSDCCQQVNGDNSCTTMHTCGSARVKICGQFNKCTQCITGGDALNEVLAECTRNVGGTARCSGSNEAGGFNFVLEKNNGVGKKNTTAQVIRKIRGE